MSYARQYEASSHGRIRRIIQGKPKEPRKLQANPQGYLVVALSLYCNVETRPVHQLVCEAFHGPRPEGMVVNHKDGVKTNNRADNLEWVTQSENLRHAFRSGLKPGKNPTKRGRLTVSRARFIKELKESGITAMQACILCDVSLGTVYGIWKGRTWTDL